MISEFSVTSQAGILISVLIWKSRGIHYYFCLIVMHQLLLPLLIWFQCAYACWFSIHNESYDGTTVYLFYFWDLISFLSPFTSFLCVLHSQTSAHASFLGMSFLISDIESTSILGKLYHYLIIPIPNFYNHNQNHLFDFDLQKDVQQSQAELLYRGKKKTIQEIKYDYNSFNRVGLSLENFLSLTLCSK